MKYTKEQLQGMSDLERNKALADILGVMWHIKPNEFSAKWMYCANYEGLDGVQLPDYCNNPNDIMPLAFEYRIGGYFGKATPGLYFALSRLEDFVFSGTNPLRAIACCLILVLQDKGDL